MHAFACPGEPQPEEIIAEVYRQLVALRQSGLEPAKVCLPAAYIRRLRIHRELLGGADNPEAEYLDRDSLFGLEFFVHGSDEIIVG